MSLTETWISPDRAAAGFLSTEVDALRYDGYLDHPAEIAGILRSLMPTDVRVLDVGCGTGALTALANEGKGNRVTCVEPDARRAAKARTRGLAVHTGFLTPELVAKLGPFDVVMTSDVLEHVADPAQFLALLKSALRPGGSILLSVPNVAHWSVRFDLLRGRFNYEEAGIMDATHLRWFTEATLLRLMRESGLRPITVKQTAGSDLLAYQRGALRHVPTALKRQVIRGLTATFPKLFGVQHVVRATAD